MSIYQGDTKISGNAMMVALPMFFATYQPRKLNNPSWLRAEPYSWHSADLYVSAYAHLADNISGVTAQTETIAGTTITFYKLSDEIKVVLPDQQTNLDTIYNATGIGYYFVLDTTNRQFKLPRNIYGFTGYRGDVGGYVAPGLPNITGAIATGHSLGLFSASTGEQEGALTQYGTRRASIAGGTGNEYAPGIKLDASLSNSIYGNSNTVQPPATQAYLYFYVGNTVQNETLADVGEMTEAINDKVDLSSSWSMPSNIYTELSIPSSGSYIQAPSDGYLVFFGDLPNGSRFKMQANADINNPSGKDLQGTGIVGNGQYLAASISVAKGQYIGFAFGTLGTDCHLRFVYAQGSEPQQ